MFGCGVEGMSCSCNALEPSSQQYLLVLEPFWLFWGICGACSAGCYSPWLKAASPCGSARVPCCPMSCGCCDHSITCCGHIRPLRQHIVCRIIVVLVVQDCSAGCRHYACLASIYLQTGFVLPSWYHDGSWAPWPCHTSTPPFYPLSASPARIF